MQDISLV